jgi:Protein of unknown function (DUF3159)
MAEPDGEPGGRARAPAARAGLAQAVGEQFSLQASVGGVRGLLESVLPLTLFSVVYGVGHDLRASVVAALVPAVALAVWRLVTREPVTQAVSGLAGLGIGAYLAFRTGRAEALFLPSIIRNAAYAGGYALSILLRWPLVGVLLGFMFGEQLHWRSVPRRARVYAWATWLWVGVFVLRLAVQVPLYLAGRAEALGVVNIPLGLPLFGLAAWLTWLLVQRVPVARPQRDGEPAGE